MPCPSDNLATNQWIAHAQGQAWEPKRRCSFHTHDIGRLAMCGSTTIAKYAGAEQGLQVLQVVPEEARALLLLVAQPQEGQVAEHHAHARVHLHTQ